MSGLFGSVQYLTTHMGNESLRSANTIKRIAASGDPVKQASMQGQGAGDVSFAANLLNGTASKRSSINAFQNAMTSLQAQADGLRQAEKIYLQMLDLASLAVDPMIGGDERALLSQQFETLRKMAVEINNQDLAGAEIFDTRAATTQYAVDFTEGATDDSPETGGIMADGTYVPGANDSDRQDTLSPYWDVQKDVIYNSGQLALDFRPWTMWDRLVVFQDDPNKPIFDTGKWQGAVYDRFVVRYGPDRETTFEFKNSPENGGGNNYSNKLSPQSYLGTSVGYLGKFGLTDDNSVSGMAAYYDKEITSSMLPAGNQVLTASSDPSSSNLTLRVIGARWGTGYDLKATWEPLEMEDSVVGRSQDLQVGLNPLGLGALREQEVGFPKISIDTRENALKAIESIGNEIGGMTQQLGNLSSNMTRVELAMDAAQGQMATREQALSGVVREDLALQMLKVTKDRIARSQNAAMLSQAINLNYDVVNMII